MGAARRVYGDTGFAIGAGFFRRGFCIFISIAEGAQFRNLCHAPGTVACIMSKPSIAICAIEEHAMTIVPASKGGNF